MNGTVSPLTRGWTLLGGARRGHGAGFPAHAGMDPPVHRLAVAPVRFPRSRGDGPCTAWHWDRPFPVSPLTRGWTVHAAGWTMGRSGFPAHAGMDPRRPRRHGARARFPRSRGDGPPVLPGASAATEVSPLTRGWTRIPFHRRRGVFGFPAHAGMDHRLRPPPSCRPGFPRSRGDGPRRGEVYLLHPGVSPLTRGWTCSAR